MNRNLFALGFFLLFLASASNASEFGRGKSCWSSSVWGTGFDCVNVTDSDNATYYYSAILGAGQYANVSIDLNDSAVYNISHVDFLHFAIAGQISNDILIWSSNDNATWIYQGHYSSNLIEYRVFNFTNGVQARWWRLQWNKPPGDSAVSVKWVGIYGNVYNFNESSANIFVPSNGTTYFNGSLTTNFSFTSNNVVSANCTRYLDGVYFNTSNVNNNTNQFDSLTGVITGVHNYNVTCVNASSVTGTKITYFIMISNATLDNCSTGNSVKILTMFLKDELNNSLVWNGTIEIDPTIYWINSTVNLGHFPFTFNLTAVFANGAANASICLSPNYTSVLFKDFIIYSASGYPQRSYALYATLSNATTNLYLYLLQASIADQVIVYVKDENGQSVGSDYDVWIQRYYVGNASYKTVAMIKTDYEGKGTTYLATTDTYYKFLISVNDTVLASIPPTIITCASGVCPPYIITLQLSQLNAPYYLRNFGSISAGCTYNNASTILTCLAIDASGLTTNTNLLVKLRNAMNFSHICDNDCASSSCTITCNLSAGTPLGNVTNHFYQYYFTGWQGSAQNLIVFDAGILDFGAGLFNWGEGSLLLAFLIVSVMFAVGLWNPVVSITLGCVGLIAAWLIGIAFVQLPALIGIIIVGALLAWKLKT